MYGDFVNNYNIVFKNLLQTKGVYFEEFKEGDSLVFTFDHNIKNGPAIRAVVNFEEETRNFCVFVVNYVTIQNPSKRDFALQLLNELNTDYSFTKFILDKEGRVSICAYLPIANNFDAELLLLMIIFVFKAAEDEYPKFMKLMWT